MMAEEEQAPPGFEEEWRTSGKFRAMVREQREKAAEHTYPKRRKASYVGVPAIFKLQLACKHLRAAFPTGDLSDKDAQLDELEKQNADLRSFLDQSVPDQLRRLYHH